MNHIFCSNCVQILNFQMAVKPKPFNGNSNYLNFRKKSKFFYEKRIVPKIDLFLSFNYGAIPLYGLGFKAI